MKSTTPFRVGLLISVCSAFFFAAYGGLELLFRTQAGASHGKFIASFACFGFLIGGILAFDTEPDERKRDRPFLRTAFGAIAGLCLGLLWRWPLEGVSLSVLVAAGLAYAGLTWAKHF